MFSINFIEPAPMSDNGWPSMYGRIVATDLDERFLSPIHYWAPALYLEQWPAAIDELFSGSDHTVLIT